MFCKKCGKEVQDDARFCPQCGTQIVVDSGASQDAAPDESLQGEGIPIPDVPQGQENASQPGIVCPACGSSDLKIERFTWWGGILGAALANRLSCRSCGHKFKINR